MNLRSLSDSELLSQTQRAVSRERDAILSLLHHLREVERRQLFSETHPSLFAYCTENLGYDAASAQARIQSMRLLHEMPELEEKVESGSLNLTLLSQAQTFFRKEGIRDPERKREVILQIEGQPTREAQKLLLDQASEPERHLPERVRPISSTHSEVRFVVDEALLEQLRDLQALLAHSHPGASLKDVIQVAAQESIARRTPKAPLRAQNEAPSYAEIERRVWHRDGGKCTHEGCGSRYALELDHVLPKAQDGPAHAVTCPRFHDIAFS